MILRKLIDAIAGLRLIGKPTLTLLVGLFAGLGATAIAGEECSPAAATESLRDRWGIEVASLRLSGQGYFVDFRYKVIDPAKAGPLANKESKPLLIDEATGRKLGVPRTPKLGALRQTAQTLVPGNIYFMFFSNRSGTIKSGSKVTVVIGDCRIEHLTVI